jgi:uncharacterized membrane protein YkvA (DUF1232 family)
MKNDDYKNEFSESGFWNVIKSCARDVAEKALESYFVAIDSKTPLWAKSTLFSALGYFVFPLDAVPDLIPFVGFSDDLAVLVAALATCSNFSTDEIKRKVERYFR